MRTERDKRKMRLYHHRKPVVPPPLLFKNSLTEAHHLHRRKTTIFFFFFGISGLVCTPAQGKMKCKLLCYLFTAGQLLFILAQIMSRENSGAKLEGNVSSVSFICGQLSTTAGLESFHSVQNMFNVKSTSPFIWDFVARVCDRQDIKDTIDR